MHPDSCFLARTPSGNLCLGKCCRKHGDDLKNAGDAGLLASNFSLLILFTAYPPYLFGVDLCRYVLMQCRVTKYICD